MYHENRRLRVSLREYDSYGTRFYTITRRFNYFHLFSESLRYALSVMYSILNADGVILICSTFHAHLHIYKIQQPPIRF